MKARLGLLAAALALGASGAWCMSLRTSSAELSLDELEPGRAYSLRGRAREAFRLVNTGADPERIEVSLERPEDWRLRDGFDPIPDLRWVRVKDPRHSLAPRGEGETDIQVKLPDDRRLLGRQFQVQVRTHASGPGGMELDLQGRLLLRMAAEPESAARRREKRARPPATASLEVRPGRLSVEAVPLGRRVGLKATLGSTFKLVNAGDAAILAHVAADKPGETPLELPEDYELAPNPHFLRAEEDAIQAGPDSVKEIQLSLEIPDEARYRGRRWAFRLKARVVGGAGNAGTDFLLLVATEGERKEGADGGRRGER